MLKGSYGVLLLSNIAIGAKTKNQKIHKIAIVDFDVHQEMELHGNDPDCHLLNSQSKLFPFTGLESEQEKGTTYSIYL